MRFVVLAKSSDSSDVQKYRKIGSWSFQTTVVCRDGAFFEPNIQYFGVQCAVGCFNRASGLQRKPSCSLKEALIPGYGNDLPMAVSTNAKR